MFMRLVEAKAKAAEIARLRWYYEDKVVPALQKTPGCLYACLMQSAQEADKMISMTMWESQASAEAYEASGLFGKLMEEVKPLLADSSEWRVELSKDLTLEQVPVPQEPTIKAYPVAVMSREMGLPKGRSKDLFLRIVSLKLKPGKTDEFRELYLHEIIPALHNTDGCRHAYLLMPKEEGHEALSVTMWDSKQAADTYEQSGRFAQLVEKVRHTFTDLFQWRMKLDHDQKRSATSDDLTVDRYSVLAGKMFK